MGNAFGISRIPRPYFARLSVLLRKALRDSQARQDVKPKQVGTVGLDPVVGFQQAVFFVADIYIENHRVSLLQGRSQP